MPLRAAGPLKLLPLLAWSGVASLAFQAEPQFWVTCGVILTLLGNILQTRQKNKHDDKIRAEDREDREKYRRTMKRRIAKVAAVTLETKAVIRSDIAANTEITLESTRVAAEALEKANGTNEKIARLASANLINKDTNETVHRIDGKID